MISELTAVECPRCGLSFGASSERLGVTALMAERDRYREALLSIGQSLLAGDIVGARRRIDHELGPKEDG